ncbi:MAG: SinR family protein [Bacillota bacterium]|nr:SinR family protein [Bacillota bacterium]
MNRLISYDLRAEGRNYDCLHKQIALLGTHEWPLQSVWLVESPLPVVALRQKLQPFVDANDGLFVGELGAWDGTGLNLMAETARALQEALSRPM